MTDQVVPPMDESPATPSWDMADILPALTAPSAGLFEKQRSHPRFGPILAQAMRPSLDFLNHSLKTNFEKQAQQQGDRLAIQDDHGHMTYDELNRAANRLAHRLLALEIPRRALIAVIMEKSCAAVAAALAVWKSGHWLLIAEPDLAQNDLLLQVDEYRIEAVLTGQALLSQFEDKVPPDSRVLLLEETKINEPDTNPHIETGPEDPARLTFTSGSTGRRKFVTSAQRRRLLACWQQIEASQLGPGDRLAAYHRLSGGPALPAVLASLLSGGSVHFYNSDNPAPRAFADWIRQHEITLFHLPPVALAQFLEALKDADPLPSVRAIQTGGQTIHRREAELFQRLFTNGTILVARYAMTETGMIATFQIDHTTPLDLPTIPAGYALPARDIYIVDDEGQLLEPEQVGEIAVHSKLPAGWDNIDRALQPVIGPATLNGERPLYRTNDMGYMRADGCLVHVGRKDDVVKVRGFRVSLVEVESALRQIPGVANAAARTFPAAHGDNRLVGYVIPEAGAEAKLHVSYLHAQMAAQVAAHVVPARFMLLDQFPLLWWGKLDRKALPDPGDPRPDLATPYRAPGNDVEAALCKLWARELEIDAVGIDDNFFDLGGDSILMTAVLLAVEREWGQDVPPGFFDHPTVAHMARLLQGDDTNRAAQDSTEAHATQPPTGRNHTRKSAGWNKQLYTRLFEIGPAMGNYTLPYGVGIRLQRALVAQAAIQRRYPRSIERLRTWHEMLDDATPIEQVIVQHLLSNTWKEWRQQTLLQDAAGFARWVTVEGEEILAQFHTTAYRGKNDTSDSLNRGIILVGPHTFINRLAMGLPQWRARPSMTITAAGNPASEEAPDINHPQQMARRAQQVLQARAQLAQGGIVRIAGDGPAGYGGTTIALGNRRLEIRPGAAELAIETGATLLPLFATIAPTGHITLHVTPPIMPGDGTRQEQIDCMTQEYARRYVRFWPRQYASMNWGFLARALGGPCAEEESQPATTFEP